MRRTLLLPLVLCLACVLPLTAQDVPGTGADSEIERIRRLVDAGALPRKALADAEAAVAEQKEDLVLNQLLYGRLTIEELTPEQAQEMVHASERRLERKTSKLTAAKARQEQGVVPLTALTPFLEEFDEARRIREMALSRARLFEELVEMVKAEQVLESRHEDEPSGEPPVFDRYDGSTGFTNTQLAVAELHYERQFGKPLPVSAKGETALHRSMGFDHRGRVDVALKPDSREGQWLRKYLEAREIPYLAFRSAIRGVATNAHIHIGPPSNRIRRAD